MHLRMKNKRHRETRTAAAAVETAIVTMAAFLDVGLNCGCTASCGGGCGVGGGGSGGGRRDMIDRLSEVLLLMVGRWNGNGKG